MDTRTLTGLAASLFTAGCALGAVGLHPTVDSPEMSRIGILLAVSSLPAWIVSSMRRASEATDTQLTDAHVAGYQLALQHLRDSAVASSASAGAEALRGCIPRPGVSDIGQAERHDR